ncbi:MAG: hypothetical protein ACYDBB_04805 [Armatimonadota bacterium]
MDDVEKYERTTLYQQVWAEPVTHVAKRYGVSDVMIRKVCRRLHVPLPPRGYWAKRYAGKPVEHPPLAEFDWVKKKRTLIPGCRRQPRQYELESRLSFLDEPVRTRVITVFYRLPLAANSHEYHPLIRRDQLLREEWLTRQEEEGRIISTMFDNTVIALPNRPSRVFLSIRVPDSQLLRVYRVLHELFTVIETLGGQVQVDEQRGETKIELLGEWIRVKVTGSIERLRFVIDQYSAPLKRIQDTAHGRVEQRIATIIIGLYKCALRLKAVRVQQLRESQLRLREEQKRQVQVLHEQEEVARFESLERDAQNWHRARMIERYVDELERRAEVEPNVEQRSTLMQQVAWAREKIQALDPLT